MQQNSQLPSQPEGREEEEEETKTGVLAANTSSPG
mgnify:CR=1 FL=1